VTFIIIIAIAIAIAIALSIVWYKLSCCKHGIYNGNQEPPLCALCIEEHINKEQKLKREKEETDFARALRDEKYKLEHDRITKKLNIFKSSWLKRCQSIDFLIALSPEQFQELIWVVYRQLGYSVHETCFMQDGGADVIVELNNQKLVLQCKRYRGNVGQPVVRDLFGTYMHLNADGAVLVTSGRVSAAARKFAKNKKIDVIDGDALLKMLAKAKLNTKVIPSSLFDYTGVELPSADRNQYYELNRQKREIETLIKAPECSDCKIGKLIVRSDNRGPYRICTECSKRFHYGHR